VDFRRDHQPERAYQTPEWGRHGDPRAPDPRAVDPRGTDPRGPDSRAPEPRSGDPRIVDPRGIDPRTVDPRGPDTWGGAGYPAPAYPVPDEGPGDPAKHATEQLDRAALRRRPGGPGQLGDGMYRSRRPGTAALFAVITVLLELVALRLLAVAVFGRPIQVGGSIASAFLALGLPIFGLGMYALVGGAAAQGAGARVWLRAPLVYLPVAVTLFLAAGLAAG
jgi:hypothetical protein